MKNIDRSSVSVFWLKEVHHLANLMKLTAVDQYAEKLQLKLELTVEVFIIKWWGWNQVAEYVTRYHVPNNDFPIITGCGQEVRGTLCDGENVVLVTVHLQESFPIKMNCDARQGIHIEK